MSIIRKPISALLSFLLIFSSMAVGFSGITPFSFLKADAASSYTAAQVKDLVMAAGSAINGTATSGNTFTYNNDDGTLVAAAEAVYDYAVNGVRGGTATNSSYNASSTLSAKVTSDTSATAAYITKLLNPGATVYGYEENRHRKTGTKEQENSQGFWSDPDWPTWSDSYYSYDTTATAQTKTITVNVNLNSYLQTLEDIDDIPDSIPLKYVYKYVNSIAQDQGYTETRSTRTSGLGGYTHYRKCVWNWWTERWNYLSEASRTPSSINTTAKSILEDFTEYFGDTVYDDIFSTPKQLLDAGYTYDDFVDFIDAAGDAYDPAVYDSGLTTNTLNHFLANTDEDLTVSAIDAYISNLEAAKDYAIAKAYADTLNPYISQGAGNGYDADDFSPENVAAMQTLYTDLSTAAEGFADCPASDRTFITDNYYPSVTVANNTAYLTQLAHDLQLIEIKAIRASALALVTELTETSEGTYMNAELLRDPADDRISNADLIRIKGLANGWLASKSNYDPALWDEVMGVTVNWNPERTQLLYTLTLDLDTSDAIVELEDYEGLTAEQAINKFAYSANYMATVRELEDEYSGYYEYFAPYIFASTSVWGNTTLMARYDADSQKLAELNAAYAAAIAQPDDVILDADVDAIFTFIYIDAGGTSHTTTLMQAAENYLDALKTSMVSHTTALLDQVADLVENVGGTISSPVVNINNFIGLKTVIDRINETNVSIVCRKDGNNYIFNIDGGSDTNESAARSAFALSNALYSYVNAKGWLSGSGVPTHNGVAYSTIYNKLTDIYIDVLKFKAAPTGVEYKTKADANGNYAIREATEDDVARQLGEDYYVTEDTIDATITKIDNFITSDDFAKIALNNMLKFKDGSEAQNLSDFIEKTLSNTLFTNDMVSTIVTALFPMVCELLDGLLNDDPTTPEIDPGIINLASDKLRAPTVSGYTAALDLGSLGISGTGIWSLEIFGATLWTLRIDSLSGQANIAMDGKKSTYLLPYVASQLGINIYPQYFAASMPEGTLKQELLAAGRYWSYFDKDGDGKVEVNEGKIVNGEMTEDVLDRRGNITTDVEPMDIGSLGRLTWGVAEGADNQYDTFLAAIGTVFSPIKDLLRTVFAGADLQKTLGTGLAHIYSNNAKGETNVIDLYLTIEGNAGGTITVSGVDGYKMLWIKIMEQLGVTDTGYDLSDAVAKGATVTGSGTNAQYVFPTLTSNASASDIARALFEPLLILINQLKAQPVRKLTQLLPQLMYFLTFDGVSDLIDAIAININLKLEVSDLSIDAAADASWWDSAKATVVSWFKSSIQNAINNNAQFDIPLALGDVLDLSDMLGFDLTNINDLVGFILEKADVDLAVPAINAGNLITAAEWTTVQSAGGGYYRKGTAHSADVLYVILEYVIRALGDSEFVNSILTLIGDSDKNGTLTEEELAAITELPIVEIINAVSSNAATHPDEILAALIELFVPYSEMAATTGHTNNDNIPTEYDYKEYDWATSTHQAYNLPSAQQASIVYLTYGNNWTQDTATKLVSGVEAAINSIAAYPVSSITDEDARAAAEKLDQDQDGNITFTEAMVGGINSMFSSAGLAGVIRGLAALGGSLAKNPALATVLSAGIETEDELDLFVWFKAFGSQIASVREQYAEAVAQAISDYDLLPEEGFDNDAFVEALKTEATQSNVEGNFASIAASVLAGMSVTVPEADITAAITEAGVPTPGSAGLNGVTMTVAEAEPSGDPEPDPGDDSQLGGLIDGLTSEDVYTVCLNGEEMPDGTEAGRVMFVDIFTRICADFAPIVAMLLGGDDMKLFDGAITIPGYEGYAQGLMQLFYVFGINEYSEIVSGEEYYNATHTNGKLDKQKTIDMFTTLTNQLFDWIDQQVNGEYILDGGGNKQYNTDGSVKRKDANFIQKVLELVPRLSWFISSNGLSTAVMNIAKPVLAIVDTLRPIVNIDADTLISVILTDLFGDPDDPDEGSLKAILMSDPAVLGDFDFGSRFDLNQVLAVLFNYYTGDLAAKYPVSLEQISFTNVLLLIDKLLDTDMAGSPFATEGLDAFIAMAATVFDDDFHGLERMSDNEKLFVAADTLTILLSMIVEGLDFAIAAGNNAGQTNGEVIATVAQHIIDGLGNESLEGLDIVTIYQTVIELLKGGEFASEYVDPNWFYAYSNATTAEDVEEWLADEGRGENYKITVADEARTVVYLDYNNNWNQETAGALEANLEVLFNQIIALVAGEDGSESLDLIKLIAEKALGSESGTIYDAKVLSSLIAEVVKLLTKLDKSLIDLVGATIGVNFDYYYNFCSFKVHTGEGEEDEDYTIYSTYADLVEDDDVTADVIKSAEVVINETKLAEWTAEFDACADDTAKKQIFLNKLEELLQPLNPIISFLLFGGSYEWFTSSADAQGNHIDPEHPEDFPYAKESLITLKGGNGYQYGLTYLLEAIGFIEENNDGLTTTLPLASEITADNTAAALVDIVEALLNKVEAIGADPVNQILDLLPGIIYFINAGGIGAVINNLLAPINGLLNEILPSLPDTLLQDTLHLDPDAESISVLDLLGGFIDDFPSDLNLANMGFVEIATLLHSFADITIPADVVDMLSHFWVGALRYYTSASEKAAFTLRYSGEDETLGDLNVDSSRRDVITLILTAVLLVIKCEDNEDAIAELLQDDANHTKYNALMQLFTGSASAYEYGAPNWDYADESLRTEDVTVIPATDPEAEDETVDNPNHVFTLSALEDYASRYTAESIVYLDYDNDWNRTSATELVGSLDFLINTILGSQEEGQTLAKLLNDLISENLYTDKIFNDILGLIVNAAVDFKDMITLVDMFLDTDIQSWFTGLDNPELFDSTTTTDGEGHEKVTYTAKLDWGIDSAAEEDKADAFAAALADFVEPLNSLLAWLLFGKGYAFFTDAEHHDVLTIPGGLGYDNAIVYLLEALGCEGIHDAAYYYDGDNVNVSAAVEDTIAAIMRRIETFTGSGDDVKPVSAILGLVPNLLYFIGADGLAAAVANLLTPVNGLLALAGAIAGQNLTLDSLLSNFGIPLDLTNLGWDAIFTALDGSELGITIPATTKEIIKTMVLGDLTAKESANGKAYIYAEASTDEQKADVVTVVIGILADIILEESNEPVFSGLLGADKFTAVKNILSGAELGRYKYINWGYFDESWTYNEFEDNHQVPAFPQEMSVVTNYLKYQNNWNDRNSDWLDTHLEALVDMIIANTTSSASLSEIVRGVLTDNIYTDSVFNAVADLIGRFVTDDIMPILGVAGVVLGTDLQHYIETYIIEGSDGKYTFDLAALGTDNGKTYDVTTAAGFAGALSDALAPLNILLDWLLFGKDIAFFSTSNASGDDPATPDIIEGNDFIKVNGAYGYNNALVYILEALGIEAPKMSDYYTGENNSFNTTAMFSAVIGSTLTRLDEIADAPITELLKILPNLIYLISADSLNVIISNLLLPADALFSAVAPFITDDGNDAPASILELVADNVDLSFGIDGFSLDLTDLGWNTVFELLDALLGITVPDVCKNVFTNFYFGEIEEKESANGYARFWMGYTTERSRIDLITVLLSVVLETIEYADNEDAIAELLNDDENHTKYNALMTLFDIDGQVYTYVDPNWDYLDETVLAGVPLSYTQSQLQTYADAINGDTEYTCVYLQYKNDWKEENAQKLVASFDALVNFILTQINEDDGATLGTLIKGILNDNVYSDAVLKDLIELVVNSLQDFKDYIEVIDMTLDTSLNDWFSDEYVQYNEETGKYTCIKNFGIENAADKQAAFASAVSTVLAPVAPLLGWLLFGDTLAFFYGSEGHDQIALRGAQGYDNALVYLLEMLGIDSSRGLKAALDYDVDGTAGYSNAEINAAVEDIVGLLVARIDELTSENAISNILEILPNVLYFMSANGLSAIINNLLAPINTVMATAAALTGQNLSLDALIGDALSGVDLNNLGWDTVAAILADKLNITIPAATLAILKTARIGELSAAQSVNSKGYILNTATTLAAKADFITLVLGVGLDVVRAEENADVFADLLGSAAKFDALLSILDGSTVLPYDEPNWDYFADPDDEIDQTAGETLTMPATSQESLVYLKYQNNWNKTAAEALDGMLIDLVQTILDATGTNIGELLRGALEDNLYTPATFNAIMNLIGGALKTIDVSVIEAVGAVLDVDAKTWLETYMVEDGDEYVFNMDALPAGTDVTTEAGFITAITELLKPLNRVASWLFLGKDYKFLYQYTGADAITIKGGYGYNMALVYLLEAIGCELPNAGTFEPAEGEADMSGANMLSAVVRALFDRLDDITNAENDAAIAEELLALIPNLIYFINANGLKVVINNLLAPAEALVEAAAPFVNEDAPETVTVASLLGDTLPIDIFDLTMETLLTFVQTIDVKDGAAIVIPAKCAALLENFHLGKLTALDPSANALAGYRMEYVEYNGDETTFGTRADFLTILISLALDIVEANDDLFAALLGDAEKFDALMTLLHGEIELEYTDPNWDYLRDEADPAYTTEYLASYAQYINEQPRSCVYLEYDNDWTNANAQQLMAVLDDLINFILSQIDSTPDSLGELISNLLTENVYTDAVLESLIGFIVNALGEFKEYLALADVVIGTNTGAWFSDAYVTEATVDGETTYTVIPGVFGIDAIDDFDEKAEAFADAVATVLEPAGALLEWLLFGGSLKFFYDIDDEQDQIIINGGEGYDNALVYLLEALGVTGLKSGAEYKADGIDSAIHHIVSRLAVRINEFAGEAPASRALELIPNVFYFIGTGGITVIINNLLQPVNGVLDVVNSVAGTNISIDAMLSDALNSTGFSLDDLSWSGIAALLESLIGIALPADVISAFEGTRLGVLSAKGSANTKPYVTAFADTVEAKADFITMILGAAGDIFKYEPNSAKFAELLGGEDKYQAILTILSGTAELDYTEPNWDFWADPAKETTQAPGAQLTLPNTASNESMVYLTYSNLWNKATAEDLDASLLDLINAILGATQDTDVSTLLSGLISDNLYNVKIFNALASLIGKAFASLDASVIQAAGALLDIDAQGWVDTYVTEVDGELAFNTEALPDDIDVATRDGFIAAMVEVFEPLDKILGWLFLGRSYAFFNDNDYDGNGENDVIVIKGGYGYDNALVYLLEALGCVLPSSDELESSGTAMLEAVLNSALNMAEGVCADPVAGALKIIANLIYFINADGLTTVVANLLLPAESLFSAAAPFLDEDMSANGLLGLITDLIGIDYINLADLSMAAIINIIENIEINGTKLDIPATSEALLKNFYIGAIESYASANHLASYKLSYIAYDGNEMTFGTEADMITIILCLAIDIIRYNDNAAVLGDEYRPIVENLLHLKDVEVDPAQGMTWYKADQVGQTINAVNESGMQDIYGEYWTREMAQYVADHFEDFVNNVLCLLGLKINGISIDSISQLADGLISSNIYTQANADKIINAIRGLVAKLDELIPPETVSSAKVLIADMLSINLDAWNDMTVTVTDGDADSFRAALTTILAPATPALALLLADVDFSILYTTDDGITAQDAITVPGSQGYAYALIPLLEALKCENIVSADSFKTAIVAEYEAGKATRTYSGASINMVLAPLTAKIDAIEDNIADEVLDLLPSLLYFINSNGADTVFTNLVTTVDTVLAAIYPALKYDDNGTVRAMTTEDLIPLDALSFTATDGTVYSDVRLEDIDAIWLVDFLLNLLKNKTGVVLKKTDFAPLTQLTNGTLTDIRSKMVALGVTAGNVTGRDGQPNGTFNPYLTMKKNSQEAAETRAALVTTLGAIIVGFISDPENNAQISALLEQYIPDESTRKYVQSFLSLIMSAFQNDCTRGYALYTIYYTFVGLDKAFEAVDDTYHDVNNTWAFLMYMLKDSGDVSLNHLESALAAWLGKNMPDIADEEHVIAPNGFIKYFQGIINFFKRLIETLKRLFGG